MSANYIQESNQRSVMTLKNHEQKIGAKSWLLSAESDLGTINNFGRRGSQYGSAAILTQLKKMAHHEQSPFYCKQVTSYLAEKNASDFNQAQKNESANIAKAFDNPLVNNFFHLGGGHDHILPLLLAIQEKNPQKKLVIINIDAHLDTRVDSWSHSGNPFRQFAQQAKNPFHLIQIGIEKFANVRPNYTALEKGEMSIYSSNDVIKSPNFIEQLKGRHQFSGENILPILSLDADALNASCMEGVSAVNPRGLSIELVSDIFDFYFQLDSAQKYCGIYEYNPLFDNLSAKGARTLASLIYPYL
jgi:formiminoglutamase